MGMIPPVTIPEMAEAAPAEAAAETPVTSADAAIEAPKEA
jgi:hypothetical protein